MVHFNSFQTRDIHTDLIDNGNIWKEKEWNVQRDTWNEAISTIRQWLRENTSIRLFVY